MKLQSKIIGILVPIIILPLLVLGWIAYQKLYNAHQEESIEKVRILQQQQFIDLHKTLENAKANVHLFSESEQLKRYLLTDDLDDRYFLMQRPLQQELISYQKAYPDYYEIRIIAADGYEELRQTSYDLKNVNNNESNSPVLNKIKSSAEDVVSMIMRNEDDGRLVLYVGKKINLVDVTRKSITTEPELKGYLILTISLNLLLEEISKKNTKQHGMVFLLSNQGKLLLEINNSQDFNNTQDTKVFDKLSDEKIPARLFEKIKHYADIEDVYIGEFMGDDSVVVGKAMHEDMYLFSRILNKEFMFESKRLGVLVAVIVFVSIFLTTSIILGVIKYLVLMPVEKLEQAAKRIGRGGRIDNLLVNADDEIGSLAKTFIDMSRNIKRSNEQAEYIAHHDNLTGLPNRLMFRNCLGHYISAAKRKNEHLALLFLDVDNFKSVNDTLGHHVGDQLLKEFSSRLLATLREGDLVTKIDTDENDVVARLGGDEFVILLAGINDSYVPGFVAKRILEKMRPVFVLDEHHVHASVSIGITLCPDDSDDAGVLTKNADIAMYHAKKNGKNNYQYFSRKMNEAVQTRLDLETHIRKAIANKDFNLHYQPQIEVSTGKITGVEALLRWTDPVLGVVTPDKFIPVAEETGLIIPIGEWVFDEACKQLRQWYDMGCDGIQVAINVSSIQFLRQRIPSVLHFYVRKYNLNPADIEIELTESIYMHSENHVTDTLSALRNMGVKIALDDFGTGYSSLAYLRRFPIDVLKIDRSFINEINVSNEGEAVINAIIRMAHAMNLKVVAEGVEDESQLGFLKKKGCDCVQGYYYYKPMPAEEVLELLNRKIIPMSGTFK